eukprot:c19799_g1_i1 orf=39-1121(+)
MALRMALLHLESVRSCISGGIPGLHETQSLQCFARYRNACLPFQSEQLLCWRWGNLGVQTYLPLFCAASMPSLSNGEDGEWKSCVSKFLSRLPSLYPSLYALVGLVERTSHTASSFAVSFEKSMLRRRTNKQLIDNVFGANANDLLAARGEGLCCTRHFVSNRVVGTQDQTLAGGGLCGPLMQMGGLGTTLLSSTAMTKDHIGSFIAILSANPTFMSGLLAWAIAQLLKVFTAFCVGRRWDFKMLLGSGGMPSSHSALCVALTTSVALCHGLSDSLFPVCLGFSLIVMYDAIGVRRHAGMQAEVLNMIVEIFFGAHPVSGKKLKELLGHTPLQVFAGALLGMLVGFYCSQGCSAVPGNGI